MTPTIPSSPAHLASKDAKDPLEGAEYVFFGWRTVHHGQAGLVVAMDGSFEVHEGPQVLMVWRSHFLFLSRVAATDTEYLAIEAVGGQMTHRAGPVTHFFNPFTERRLQIKRKMRVDSGLACVVYTSTPSTPDAGKDDSSASGNRAVVRRVVHGPMLYMPAVGEWFQRFHWEVPASPGQSRATSFFKLRTVPDQLQFTVLGVRTKDDALFSMRFMVFYHLKDVAQMLTNTHDPCGDLTSTISADAMDWAGQRSFETFKTEGQELNRLETYPQTRARLEACGYVLLKVAYRGYGASQRLQDMHNTSIELRTQLTLEGETEARRQALEDMKQERTSQRVIAGLADEERKRTTEMAMEKEAALRRMEREQLQDKHERAQAHLKFEAEQARIQASHEAELRRGENVAALELKRQKDLDEARVSMLRALHKDTGLDVTRYVVAQEYRQPDKRIEVVGSQGQDPTVHLHSNL